MQFNFTINIDDRIIQFLRKILTKRNIITIIIAAVIGTSIFLYASDVSVNSFTSGTAISSADVNENFTNLQSAINTRLKVQDNNNVVLGTALYTEDTSYWDGTNSIKKKKLWIMSPTGYIFPIFFDGTLPKNIPINNESVYNQGTCATPVLSMLKVNSDASVSADVIINPKEVFIFDPTTTIKCYVPALNVSNEFQLYTVNTAYASVQPHFGTCYASGGDVSGVIRVMPVNNVDLGISATLGSIVGPLRIREYIP